MNSTFAIDDETYATVDVLASDFIARYRNGDRPTVDEYAHRHPNLSDAIRRIFPLMLSVEKVKIDQQAESDGSATLAGRRFERLGDFRLVREIGRGGMGIVYEAEQESLGRTVAIKILPKQSLLDDIALKRFQREAKTAAAMHHSNIVPIFGTGEYDGTHYLVMQLVRGESLAQRIKSEGSTFDIHPAAMIARQVADGLAYAHECGVLHRDIKPANILIDADGTAQVTDFGLARNIADDPTMTQALSGSPRYMAPERFRGVSDERCDVYAVGLTLYEMLAGTPAFTELNSHELMDAVTHHRMKPLENIRSDVPIDMRTIVSKATSLDPAHRYQTAAEIRDDLDRFLSDQPIHARRISTTQRFVRWCRRNTKVAALSGVAIFSLVAATVASSVGFAMISAANNRTTEALIQSERTVDLALQSLDGVVDSVSTPASAMGELQSADVDSIAFQLNPSPHAAKVLANVQPLYERLASQSPSRPDIVLQMTEASIRLSQIQQQLGKTEVSASTLRRSIDLLETRSEIAGLPSDDKQRLFARLFNNLGKVHALELRYDQSDLAYQQAIEAAKLAANPDELTRLQLAHAYVSLGDPPPQRRRDQSVSPEDSRLAREQLSLADSILTELTGHTSVSSEVAVLRARIELAESRFTKRPMVRQMGFASAIQILREQLEKTPDNTRVRFALVESLASVNLRRQASSPTQANGASERLQEALAELRPLRLSYPEAPLFAVSEVHILHKLSNLAKSENDFDLAMEQIENAIAIQTSLVETAPQSMPHRCWRALLYRSLAEVHRKLGNAEAERRAIDAASKDVAAIDAESRLHPFAIQTNEIIQELETQAADTNETTPNHPKSNL